MFSSTVRSEVNIRNLCQEAAEVVSHTPSVLAMDPAPPESFCRIPSCRSRGFAVSGDAMVASNSPSCRPGNRLLLLPDMTPDSSECDRHICVPWHRLSRHEHLAFQSTPTGYV